MSGPAAQAVTFAPLHMALTPDLSISGQWLRGAGRITVLALHDIGADLDAVLPLLANIGLPEAHKIAVDLPGHGLSDGAQSDALPALDLLCDRLAGEGHGPLVIVGFGHSAGLAWQLGRRDDVLGLCLVSPVAGAQAAAAEQPFRRAPVLVFLAAASPPVIAAWAAYKARLRGRWLSVSLAVTHDDLTALRGCERQVASHLGGFARDLMAQAAPASAPP